MEKPESGPGLFNKFRGLFSAQSAAPAGATAVAEPPPPTQDAPVEPDVVAPGGYHVQPAPAQNPSGDDFGQMIDPVRDGLALLPPLNRVVTELLREIQNENSSAASIAEIVSSDPTLAAALIRTVNSAAFGLQRRIASVSEAVSYLGLSIVKSMVIRLRLGEVLTPVNRDAEQDVEDLWIHSLAVSYAADCLAKRVSGVDRGFVSTLGLLHDVGKLAVTARLPGQAAAIRELIADQPTSDQRELEARVLGIDHAGLGADLAARWQLPADLIEAIRWHHRPMDTIAPGEALAFDKVVGVLRIANQLAKYCYPSADHVQIDAIDDRTFAMLGLEPSLAKLLDDSMRQAISRAIFFVHEKPGVVMQRRFLRPLRDEAAVAAASASHPATHVAVNDAVLEAMFATPGVLVQKFRATPEQAEKCVQAALANLKKLDVPGFASAAAATVISCLIPNLLTVTTPFETLEFAQQKRGNHVVMAFRAGGMLAARRTRAEQSPEAAARLAEADFGHVLNLGWFSRLAISHGGDAVILLSK